ncbi:S-locus receptor kinase (SRK) [Zostera marina]|uniref:non-specific serine/threonine protein kinase n=1 Tax=Zostera marina TaxID=29655 RepID=A0A0K9NS31_ZOSMR|nr:S-locus receptor kinase (SRK) [Zostera marina]
MLLFLRHLLLSGFLLTIFISICSARDTLNTRSSMQDGDNLVSEGKKFALEFFNPIGSNKRYLGVRYVDFENKVIWVANRDYPINDKSGVLKIGNNGNLVLIESKNNTIVWSPRGTFNAKNHTAQILDSGNLVLKEDGGSKILWQSFDYPTDTMIPGVKVGFNTKMHLNWSLTSWKADNDPSSGNHVYMMDHRGSNEIYIKTKEINTFRMGPWNGIHFSDYPSMKIFSNIRFMYVNEETERYYSFEYNGKGSISRFVILPNGHLEFYEYSLESKKWSASGKGLNDECDLYSKCGSNGVCDMSVDGFCSCLRGYTPANRVEWENRYFKGGCKRIIKNLCHSGEGFRSVKQIKFPDIRNATLDYKSNDNIEDCRHKCLENCSCTAYSAADVSKKPSKGCILWYGDLNDIKQFNFGDTELFLRLPASELEIEEKKSNKKMFMIITASVVASASFLIILFVLAFVCWKKNKGSMTTTLDFGNMQNPNLKNELEFFSLSAILSATRNFADDNKIGHGGFGSVFKGKMPNGVNIAVKRLFRVGGKGIQGNIFMNEAELIAKCQHKNLVRLLGCCIEGEERMLVFEFMQNSSAERHKLNWKKRVEIIIGISKGLQYLHEDSRLKIVHRDIKAGNILLDEDMNPKITDLVLQGYLVLIRRKIAQG